jgi:hypothetical protein
LLVPPADPGALAGALNRVLRDRAMARQMGRAGRRRVEEHFSWASIAARTKRMYEELLREKGRLRQFASPRPSKNGHSATLRACAQPAADIPGAPARGREQVGAN